MTTAMDELPDKRYRPCVLCDQLVEQTRRPETATYRPWICATCAAGLHSKASDD